MSACLARSVQGSSPMLRAYRHLSAALLTASLLFGLLGISPQVPGADGQEALAVRWEANVSEQPEEAPGGELRDALAHVVIERNVITTQRDSLLQQRWLIIAYAAGASLIALWFMRMSLLRSAPGRNLPSPTRNGTKPAKKVNATITIRNADTQQPELVEQVTTRKLFRQRPAPVPRTPAPTFRTPAPAAKAPPISVQVAAPP